MPLAPSPPLAFPPFVARLRLLASQLFNIFAAVVTGKKLCTTSLAARIAAVLRSTQALFPPALLAQVWTALEPQVRATVQKILEDPALAAGAPGSPS